MLITQLTTNLRPREDRPSTVALGQRTLIVGRNASGKTRLLNSVELALSGAADDLLGRQEVKSAGYLMLAGDPEQGLHVVAEFDDGKTSEYHLASMHSRGKVTLHPGLTDSEWTLPVRTVYKWLVAGPEKAREAFLPHIARGVSPELLQGFLKGAGAVMPYAGGALPVDIPTLLAAIELAKKRIGELGKEREVVVKRWSALELQLGDAEPTKEQVRTANETLEQTRKRRDYVKAMTMHMGTARRIAELQAQISECYATIDAAFPLLSPPPAEPPQTLNLPPVVGLLEDGLKLLHRGHQQGLSRCPCCGTGTTPGQAQAWEAEVNSWFVGLAEERRNAAQVHEHWRASQVAYTQAKDRRMQAEGYIAQLESQLQALVATLPQGDVEMDDTIMLGERAVAEAEAVFEAALLVVGSLKQRAAAYEQWMAAGEHLNQLEQDTKNWKAWLDGLQKTLGELLAACAALFTEEMDRWMPEGKRAVLILDDDGREEFKMGLIDGPYVNAAPSGAELVMIMFAATAVILDRLPEEERPKYACFMVPKECGYDSDTLKGMLEAWQELPYQVLLASTVPVDGEVDGWTYVPLSSDKPKRRRKGKGKATTTTVAGTGTGAPPLPQPPERSTAEVLALLMDRLSAFDPDLEYAPWTTTEAVLLVARQALYEAEVDMSDAGLADVLEVVWKRRIKQGRKNPAPVTFAFDGDSVDH